MGLNTPSSKEKLISLLIMKTRDQESWVIHQENLVLWIPLVYELCWRQPPG